MRKRSSAASNEEQFYRLMDALGHRAKQPLTALRGTLEVALMSEAGVGACRQAIELSLQQADRLIETLELLSAVIDSADPGGARQPVAWAELIRKALTELRPSAEFRGVHPNFRAKGSPIIRAHPERIYEATKRALARALHRSPKGAAIRVSLRASRRFACLTISDQGKPLASEELDPFQAGLAPQAVSAAFIESWVIARIVALQGGNVSFQNQRSLLIRMPRPAPRGAKAASSLRPLRIGKAARSLRAPPPASWRTSQD